MIQFNLYNKTWNIYKQCTYKCIYLYLQINTYIHTCINIKISITMTINIHSLKLIKWKIQLKTTNT
jgi:hypothetical protein